MRMKCPKCNFENPTDTKFCGECAAPLHPSDEISAPLTETLETPTEELTTGSTFAGRYQIIEELGKGGMGKVYKAQDTDLKEKVAIKLLRPEIAADKKTIERFRNELKFARKIRHKNVCQMYDLNKEAGLHYITMEYVDGKDLKSMIRMMGQLGSGKTIFIAKQVCEGLVEAHRLGVVHRDLKPQNIMVDEDGNARIMDFGIARSLKTKGITAAGVMIGTPEYMSPEQVEGKEVDQRSDIYSLGVILYEMVTGRVPFEGDTPFTIGVKHKSEMPKDPKEFNTQLPEDLNLVILRCLEKDREKRYQSAGEVRAELTRIEKGIPTTEIEIPKRKPITSKEITVTFGLKKLLIPAVVAIALIIAAIIIWQLLPRKEAVPFTPSDKPSLAIMYFKNNTGEKDLDHWRTMLSNLLIADLTQSKHIRILSEDKLFNILSQLSQLEEETYSSEVLEQVAAQGGVNHILQGAYAKAGDEYRINVMLQDASTGELIGSESVEGKGEKSIFSMVDELTRRIKANFKLSPEEIASDIDKNIGKITTSSPEAYKLFIEGNEYEENKGDIRKAISYYEKAVAIDPEFATAYLSIGIAYWKIGLYSEEKRYYEKALELSDRISDRERYLVEAEYYSRTERTYGRAIELFKKLLEIYPDDSWGNNDFGWLYNQIEEWDKAIERLEVNIHNKDSSPMSYTVISKSYDAKGLYDRTREVLGSYLNNFPDNVYIHLSLGGNYLCQGKYDLALLEADKAIFLNPDLYRIFFLKGSIYLFKEDLEKAEKEYLNLLEQKEPIAQVWGILGLSKLYLSQGRFKQSKNQLKQGIELAEDSAQTIWKTWFYYNLAMTNLGLGNPESALKELNEAWKTAIKEEDLSFQRSILHAKGLAHLEMKLLEKAKSEAIELKEMIEKGLNKKAIRLYYHLAGMIELEGGNFSEAIDYFKKAISLLPFQSSYFDEHAFFIESLASAYIQLGNLENALAEYERITALTTGRLPFGDVYAKSFYMLGRIYEQKGLKGKAIEHYGKFLELWKDADPGIPEVEDARKRLATIQVR